MALKKNLAPSARQLEQPVYNALVALGGSGTVDEIFQQVVSAGNYTQAELTEPHAAKNEPKIKYNLRWALTKLKVKGLTSNSNGIWSLTNKAAPSIKSKPEPSKSKTSSTTKTVVGGNKIVTANWKHELIGILKTMDPTAFEHFSKEILGKCGLKKLQVTGRSGDEGIDGIGVISVKHLTEIKIAFQCKRYKNQVSSVHIRNFIGSLAMKHISNGFFITTSSISKDMLNKIDELKDVTIKFIDCDGIIDLLTKNKMGVRPISTYEIDKGYFESFDKTKKAGK